MFQVLLPLLLGAAALHGADQAPQAADEEHQDGRNHEQQQEPGLQPVRLRLSGSDLKLNFSLHVIFNNVKNVFPHSDNSALSTLDHQSACWSLIL